MIIIGTTPESMAGRHIILIFGVGMIGSAIRNSLTAFGFQLISDVDFSWDDSEKRAKAFPLIEALCLDYFQNLECISVVWSAGRSGFHSTQDEAAQENHSFIDTIGFVTKLKTKLNDVKFHFHYLSSAGGLFEGQRVVNKASIPAPIRPYGHLKLTQEKSLQESFNRDELSIYRPSSVYGPMSQKSQQGLINNLVSNGRNARVTTLDAHVMSLRDYVFSGDIGIFIAKRVKSEVKGLDRSHIFFLVSARCSSIFEVVLKVERTLNMNINVRYDESFGNNTNITFSDSVLSAGWAPSALNVGIRQFLVGKTALY